MKPFYIHVGYGKTATTWLQDRLYVSSSQCSYFGKTSDNYPGWLIRLHYLDDYAFLNEREKLKTLILQRHIEDPQKASLVSSEAFTNFTTIIPQANRIKDVFPFPRIILTIRNPISLLESYYKQNVKGGYWFLDLEQYLDRTRTPFAIQKRPPIYLPDLFYDEVIEYYGNVFGRENVCVLRYEDFVKAPNDFVAQLGSFMGVDFGDVTELAKEKVLEGLAEDLVPARRLENLRNYLSTSFPDLAKHIESYVSLADLEARPIISQELERRLTEYFKPKCSMYFQEKRVGDIA